MSNLKIMTEQLTGVTSITMSVRLLDRMPLTSIMQQHQKLLQIMSNGKYNCTSEMYSQIMSCFCRLSQSLEDDRACRHTKLEHVSSCTTNTATCHWVQSSRVKSHLGQHISPRARFNREARFKEALAHLLLQVNDSCNIVLSWNGRRRVTVGIISPGLLIRAPPSFISAFLRECSRPTSASYANS